MQTYYLLLRRLDGEVIFGGALGEFGQRAKMAGGRLLETLKLGPVEMSGT